MTRQKIAGRIYVDDPLLVVLDLLRALAVHQILCSAVSETEELVTAAVNATGIPQEHAYWTELTRIEYITVRLLGFEETIRIEAWDSVPHPPHLPDDPNSPIKRGYYPTPRGKVVWVELPLLPQRSSHPVLPAPEQFAQDDPDLLRRVRDGLEGL